MRRATLRMVRLIVPAGNGRRHDNLAALAIGQDGRDDRIFRCHVLARLGSGGNREILQVESGQRRNRVAGPAPRALDEHLARPIDHDFGQGFVVEERFEWGEKALQDPAL